MLRQPLKSQMLMVQGLASSQSACAVHSGALEMDRVVDGRAVLVVVTVRENEANGVEEKDWEAVLVVEGVRAGVGVLESDGVGETEANGVLEILNVCVRVLVGAGF